MVDWCWHQSSLSHSKNCILNGHFDNRAAAPSTTSALIEGLLLNYMREYFTYIILHRHSIFNQKAILILYENSHTQNISLFLYFVKMSIQYMNCLLGKMLLTAMPISLIPSTLHINRTCKNILSITSCSCEHWEI